MCSIEHKHSTKTLNTATQKEKSYGFSPLKSRDERVSRKVNVSSVVEEKIGEKYRKDVVSMRKGETGSGVSSLGYVEERVEIKSKVADKVVDEKLTKISKKSSRNSKLGNAMSNTNSVGSNAICQVGEGKTRKRRKKEKVENPESKLRAGLDMCSKRGDFLSAISLYDTAQKEGVKLGQYHYTVLLYLCSSAAVGVIRPAKSGSGTRTSDKLDLMNEVSSAMLNGNVQVRLGPSTSSHGYSIDSNSESHGLSSNKAQEINDSELEPVNDVIPFRNKTERLASNIYDKTSNTSNGFYTGIGQKDSDREREGSSNQEDHKIQISEDVKKYALVRGFEIYESLCLEKIPLNEATLTSVARMAMSMGNGDMALEMVNKMKEMGINPRLRSYGPALFTFCNSGDIERAFMVEEHMLENGVYPEEPELEALLRLSVEAGRGDKVYYLLQKLRNSIRKVSPSTADLIERWFRSKPASTVGERNWDQRLIMEAMENGGGGWHGQGWLGKGRWNSARTFIGTDGVCESCGDKLVTIDLDTTETENFAKSVASIASKRERKSSFQNFQKWLDYYGPFEAVVDAANVGLYSQRHFSTSKVNAIVNGIRQKLPTKKWPLIVLHNKRITGGRMDEPANKTLVEKWKNADALYATPTGSNDDWYWLYAAIKFKCLLVTNDEMRDHIFQLLGNDFFPRWKERHQVHFSFSDSGPEFIMPPPCSVVIQ
ncbi:Proteinaceous rnase p, partial [Thalictrum thalictroides]